MRVKSNKPMKNGGWFHNRANASAGPVVVRKPKPRKTDTELATVFEPLARRYYVKNAERTSELATLLGVAEWTLNDLHVGWDGSAWTFPEQNHRGHVIGIKRRLPGKKLYVVGSRPGLCYAENWLDYRGPVFIVEGASDVAAGLTLGLCMVGRPSATGGVDYLTLLLGKYASDRRIIILAEDDEKDRAGLVRHDSECQCCQQCWPGKAGAMAVADKLGKRLQRMIYTTFLPNGAKDLRAWLNQKRVGPENQEAMLRLGRTLSSWCVNRRAWR